MIRLRRHRLFLRVLVLFTSGAALQHLLLPTMEGYYPVNVDIMDTNSRFKRELYKLYPSKLYWLGTTMNTFTSIMCASCARSIGPCPTAGRGSATARIKRAVKLRLRT